MKPSSRSTAERGVSRLIERNVALVPVLAGGLMVAMLVFGVVASVRPLYEVAYRGEIARMDKVGHFLRKGLDDETLALQRTLDLMQHDAALWPAMRAAVERDDFKALRALLRRYQRGGQLDFLEIVTPEGKVLNSVGLKGRFDKDVSGWDVFRRSETTVARTGVSRVGDDLYLVATLYAYGNGQDLVGMLVAGRKVDDDFLADLGGRFGAELHLVRGGKVRSTSARERDEALLARLASAGDGDGVVQHNGRRWASTRVTLRSLDEEPLATLVAGTSLQEFDGTVQRTYSNVAFTLLFPVLATAALLTMLGRFLTRAFKDVVAMKERFRKILVLSDELSGVYDREACLRALARHVKEHVVPARAMEFEMIRSGRGEGSPTASFRAGDHASVAGMASVPLALPFVASADAAYELVLRGAPGAKLTAGDGEIIRALCGTMGAKLATIEHFEHARAQAERQARTDSELHQASAVQDTLLPRAISVPGLEFESYYSPALHAGGDWFGIRHDEERSRLYVFMGDVTGHGVAAALVTGMVHGAISLGLEILGQADRSGEEVLDLLARRLNALMHERHGTSGHLMTMAMVSLDLRTGLGSVLSAGHEPVVLIAGDRTHAVFSPGSPLGLSASPTLRQVAFQLRPDDRLFLYTDGLVENETAPGETFGRRKLRTCLGPEESLAATAERLRAQAITPYGTENAQDDVCFLLLRWRPGATGATGAGAQPENESNAAICLTSVSRAV